MGSYTISCRFLRLRYYFCVFINGSSLLQGIWGTCLLTGSSTSLNKQFCNRLDWTAGDVLLSLKSWPRVQALSSPQGRTSSPRFSWSIHSLHDVCAFSSRFFSALYESVSVRCNKVFCALWKSVFFSLQRSVSVPCNKVFLCSVTKCFCAL